MNEQDDIKIEPENDEVKRSNLFTDGEEEEKLEDKIAKMREELGACQKEKQEYMNGWQRSKADYVNALKRFEEDAKASEFRGKLMTVETLLPVFDALERAKEHGEIPAGFLAIARQLDSAFAALGLEEIGVVGEKFNPAFHDAFGQDAVDSIETDDTITVVLEKGWKIDKYVIRPAKIRVGHFAS